MGECDEPLLWRKSSFSMAGECVEWALAPDGGMRLRDSKDPGGPRLSFTRGEWTAFLAAVRRGEADLTVDESSG